MDFNESTEVVYNRIQKLEPENVSKIIGFLLLHQQGEREMIRLAFSPDNSINAWIEQAKSCLGLNKLPISASQANHLPALEVAVPFGSYATTCPHPVSSPVMQRAATSYWDAPITGDRQQVLEFVNQSVSEDYRLENQMHLLTLDEASTSSSSELPTSYFYPESAAGPRTSRRSPSMPVYPDKVCHYYSKGFCKHGSNCRYFHGHPMPDIHFSSNSNEVGSSEDHVVSPLSLEKLEMELTELLKSRRGMPVSIASLPMMYFEKYGRTLQAEGYLTESQRHGKAGFSLTKLLARLKNTIRLIDKPHGQHSVVLEEDAPKHPENSGERNDPGGIVAGSRQIYLTFPAECTFTEQDVSNYFSKFGPVQDVRIPCQQKRMFGFVTFNYAETVKEILAKGNPHFVCGARVLVKPYREKSRLVDRKYADKIQHQTYHSLHFVDGNSDQQSMSSNSRLIRKRFIVDYEHGVELERRQISEMQFRHEPLYHQSYFGYSSDGSKLAEEQIELESSERFSYLLDILNNSSGDEKLRNINTNFSDQDSNQSLNLPESPFASTMGCGISTAS